MFRVSLISIPGFIINQSSINQNYDIDYHLSSIGKNLQPFVINRLSYHQSLFVLWLGMYTYILLLNEPFGKYWPLHTLYLYSVFINASDPDLDKVLSESFRTFDVYTISYCSMSHWEILASLSLFPLYQCLKIPDLVRVFSYFGCSVFI